MGANTRITCDTNVLTGKLWRGSVLITSSGYHFQGSENSVPVAKRDLIGSKTLLKAPLAWPHNSHR